MSNIQQVELSIGHAREGIAFGEALDRLLNNRDFQKVILDGYLKDEAVRLVHLKSDPGMDSPAEQAGIDMQIVAIGRFSGWLKYRANLAQQLRKELAENEAELEELRREEAGE